MLGDRALDTEVNLGKYVSMRYAIVPGESQDALQAPYMEVLLGLDVIAVDDSGLYVG